MAMTIIDVATWIERDHRLPIELGCGVPGCPHECVRYRAMHSTVLQAHTVLKKMLCVLEKRDSEKDIQDATPGLVSEIRALLGYPSPPDQADRGAG